MLHGIGKPVGVAFFLAAIPIATVIALIALALFAAFFSGLMPR